MMGKKVARGGRSLITKRVQRGGQKKTPEKPWKPSEELIKKVMANQKNKGKTKKQIVEALMKAYKKRKTK